ncbi:hypothetical protein QE369_001204 [Agrobacterium larrymoorei]|uniref:Uncharacterized protein n=1 Tax=Agrobacterium larrymoorei TaxID=160699 RepID=A0AAJ2B7V5_9HYPH|nr:hypothetical protein [Agrobacterium larrymoorei]MDR6101026.1 hypothetical protein [Agrobacterium larrymoorei]
MAWGNKKRNWQKRSHAGYAEYRYGGKTKKPTLPQVFKGEVRKAAINEVMDALDDWRNSPFEHEGAVHHGLRSALCLKGLPWAVSDHEAVALVAEAFGRLGHARPSWEEAQRWYTEPQENCRGCGAPLLGEVKNGSRLMYCSTECARMAMRDIERKGSADRTYGAIYRAMLRFQFSPIACGHCKRDFLPRRADQRLCSLECQRLSRRTIDEVTCQHCEKPFRPKTLATAVKFCSAECRWSHTRSQQSIRNCELCGIEFLGTQGTRAAIYCCDAHGKAASQIRKKVHAAIDSGRVYKPVGPHREYALRMMESSKKPSNVIYLTPEVFDGLFKLAA